MNLTLCRMPIFRHLHIDSCIWMFLGSSVSYSKSCDHHDAKKMEGISRHNFKPCEPVFGRKWFVGYVWICFDSLLGPCSKDSKVSVSTVPRKGFTVSHTSSRIPPTIPNVYWLIYMVGKPIRSSLAPHLIDFHRESDLPKPLQTALKQPSHELNCRPSLIGCPSVIWAAQMRIPWSFSQADPGPSSHLIPLIMNALYYFRDPKRR